MGKGTAIGARHLDRRLSSAAYYGRGGCEEGAGCKGGDGEGGEEVEAEVEEMVQMCEEHGVPCVVFTCKKRGANKGRRFFKCGVANRFARCRFFAWEDERGAVDGEGDGQGGKGKETSCAGGSEAES